MYSRKSYQQSVRASLPTHQKDRYLVDSCSPLYKCVSSTNQKLKSSDLTREDYDWGKWHRRSRYSDISDIAKSTPSLYITTYKETVYLSPDDTGNRRNRSLSPLPSSGKISPLPSSGRISSPSLRYQPNGESFRSLSPSPIRRSSSFRRSLPSSSGSSVTLPSFSRSSGIYSDLLDDDQMSLPSSIAGSSSVASTRNGHGQGPLQRLAQGSPGRSLVPWYLSDLDIDLYKQQHTASDILQDEIRHGKSNLNINCSF